MTGFLIVDEAPRDGALLDRLLEIHAAGRAADADLDAIDALLGWSLDPLLRGHLIRCAGYGQALARALGLDHEHAHSIRWGAMLHDIGKVRVAASVLGKCGALTPAETREIRRHTLLGAEMVEPLRQGGRIARIIATHHERWNGAGYPLGLAGEAIPLEARFVSVVDGFDAMSSHRAYRPALPRQEVVRRMGLGRGTQWQPEIVDALLELLQRGELDAIVSRPATPIDPSRLQRAS